MSAAKKKKGKNKKKNPQKKKNQNLKNKIEAKENNQNTKSKKESTNKNEGLKKENTNTKKVADKKNSVSKPEDSKRSDEIKKQTNNDRSKTKETKTKSKESDKSKTTSKDTEKKINKKEDKEIRSKENINNATKSDKLKIDIKQNVQKENKIKKLNENIKKIKEKISSKKNNLDKEKSELEKNKKRKIYILICIIVLVILIIGFSTLFALFNFNNDNIIKGISIKGIDISDLSKEEATNKLDEITKTELIPEISLKYEDNYEISFNPEQIEFKYEIANAVEEAYFVGRNNNLLINNYTLLFTTIFDKKLPISYTYNETLLNQFVDGIASEIPGVVVEPTYYIEERKLIISKGTDGIAVKKEDLKEDILKAVFDRNIDKITADGYKQELIIPVEEAKASKIDIDKIYEEIHTEPKDAYFEANPYKIYPDVDGIDLAISVDEAKKIIESEDKEEYEIDLNITKAKKTIHDLGKEAFPYLVSSFSTKYDASNVNRSTNLKIAARKIDGKVLMPGEEFSYNKVVGKRTVEEGYRDAKIFADGGVVDGLAGGICQISSTLYNVVLLANLEVTERKNHTYTTSYVPAGRDATVVYGVKDFKFKNSREYPIKIEATVNGGIAEFKIYGVQQQEEYEIRILPVTTGSIPYSTKYTQDASLAPGQHVVSQSGHAGYKVTTYKEVRLNGNVISKEVISNDTYSPMHTIIRVGPGVPAAPTSAEPAPVQGVAPTTSVPEETPAPQ